MEDEFYLTTPVGSKAGFHLLILRFTLRMKAALLHPSNLLKISALVLEGSASVPHQRLAKLCSSSDTKRTRLVDKMMLRITL